MQEKTLVLVSLLGKEGQYVTRKDSSGKDYTIVFIQSEEHEDQRVSEVSFSDALALVRATPWLFYPFYPGINIESHFSYTKRDMLNPGVAAQILERPEEMAKGIFDPVVHLPEPSPTRQPSDEEYGIPGEDLRSPSEGPEAGTRDKEMSPMVKDGESASPQEVSPTADYSIPGTIEEVNKLPWDDLRMLVAIKAKIPLSQVIGKKPEVVAQLARMAEEAGQPIDGYVPEKEVQSEGE